MEQGYFTISHPPLKGGVVKYIWCKVYGFLNKEPSQTCPCMFQGNSCMFPRNMVHCTEIPACCSETQGGKGPLREKVWQGYKPYIVGKPKTCPLARRGARGRARARRRRRAGAGTGARAQAGMCVCARTCVRVCVPGRVRVRVRERAGAAPFS